MRTFSLQSSDRKDTLLAGEKILLLLLCDKREKSLDVLRVHKQYEKMSGQTRHPVKVKAFGPTSTCASDILSDTGFTPGQCAGSLIMELAADKTRNNGDQNDQTSYTTRAVKNS